MPPPIWAGAHANEIPTDPDEFIFFLSSDEVPYGCFSNAHRERNGHYAANIIGDAKDSSAADAPKFWCVNQELHYQKAMFFEDTSSAHQILAERNDATKIKQLGRMVRGYDDAKWCEVRYDVCRNALYAKFMQNEESKRILLGTGTKIIVEAARDKTWGIGCVETTTSTTSDDDGVMMIRGAKKMET
eukprot:CAMPEP_0181130000 /NCGR_PEP_ID=MMETSP1071-20121207/29624_1 /TAXON_ID=35127 /ORGANISM="Thalassiosira sp., Strain NH16" /LENGTH=186 /DNA_ID=CAMNT_0023216029 /DNA_START=60 /DNA_END=617 /DNA_ORIENTATION=+